MKGTSKVPFIIRPVVKPLVTGISPGSGKPGQKILLTISGKNFLEGTLDDILFPSCSLPRGNTTISINDVMVVSETKATGTGTTPADAKPGVWKVVYQQDDAKSNQNITFTIRTR